MKHREIKALPEQIAFNLIMAIVPLLVVIVQLGTYLSLNTDIVKYLITAYAPQEVQQLLLTYLIRHLRSNQEHSLLSLPLFHFFGLFLKDFMELLMPLIQRTKFRL